MFGEKLTTGVVEDGGREKAHILTADHTKARRLGLPGDLPEILLLRPGNILMDWHLTAFVY